MAELVGLVVGTAGDAAKDWSLISAACIVFVALIAVPATVMNSRDHKRHQEQERQAD